MLEKLFKAALAVMLIPVTILFGYPIMTAYHPILTHSRMFAGWGTVCGYVFIGIIFAVLGSLFGTKGK